MSEPLLARLLEPRPLSEDEARAVFDRLLDAGTTDLERATLLVGLAARPVGVPELVAFAREMRKRATPFELPPGDAALDLCGTGGAPTPSFNVSTVSAFVVAAAGVPVVKHGNRSALGRCGSSDLLEALGLPVTRSLAYARRTYRTRRIAFLHAPLYHPATRAVAAARRAIGIPTIFNRLGPLCNPAPVRYQVTGAPSADLARGAAEVLRQLGVRRGVAMASDDGCDEFSPRAPTSAFAWGASGLKAHRIQPETYLGPAERRGDWTALGPAEAAVETERLLAGGPGARRGSVVLTSGMALWLAGEASSVARGVERARGVLDDGSAAELLSELRELAGPLSGEPE